MVSSSSTRGVYQPFDRVNCPTSEMLRRKKSEHPIRYLHVAVVDLGGGHGDGLVAGGFQLLRPGVECPDVVRGQVLSFFTENPAPVEYSTTSSSQGTEPPGKISVAMNRMNRRSVMVIGMPISGQRFSG